VHTKLVRNVFEDLAISDEEINYSNISSNYDHESQNDEGDSDEFFIDKDENVKLEKIQRSIDKYNMLLMPSNQHDSNSSDDVSFEICNEESSKGKHVSGIFVADEEQQDEFLNIIDMIQDNIIGQESNKHIQVFEKSEQELNMRSELYKIT
jgi:hypothetical protein